MINYLIYTDHPFQQECNGTTEPACNKGNKGSLCHSTLYPIFFGTTIATGTGARTDDPPEFPAVYSNVTFSKNRLLAASNGLGGQV